MNIITAQQVEAALPKIESGLRQYCWIQSHVRRVDVRNDAEFQRRYNAFYRVRRSRDWRTHYFSMMESHKSQDAVFADALHQLRRCTGRIEASFASKLIATLNPRKPVIDKFVLGNLGLRLPYYSAKRREERTVGVYDDLCGAYEVFMGTPEAHRICGRFAEVYPWADVTDLKKVDLVLWQTRE